MLQVEIIMYMAQMELMRNEPMIFKNYFLIIYT